MPPITASFGSSCLLSFDLVGRPRSPIPAPPYTSRDLYVFTSSTSFNFGAARTFEYLVVGGGGGGGTGYGGGGGGGGIRVGTSTTPSPGTLQIYVGGGGAPNANGGNSGFWHPSPIVPTSVWAEGGGRGGATDLALPSANGGSGGGGYGGQSPLIGFGGFATTSPFGNAGGAGGYYAGGGGGANSAGGFGVSANNVKMVKASIYSTYSGGTRGGNYSVQWSNNGISWTTSFSGVMSSNACGIFDGSITSSPSLGRYPFWRYVVGSNTATHHPRSSRIYLTDEYNNTYQVVSYTDDNCSDSGVIPAPGEIFTIYETGLSTPVTRSGNGGSAFTSTLTGFATPFGAGGGGWNSYGGDWSAGGASPSPSTSAMQRRGGGGAGGSGTPGGSGGSGVVIISTPRALGPAADNTQFSFANTTTWQAPTGLNTIELLLVAGGGGGGSGFGGGGGAGGVRFTPSFPVSPGLTYNITIGAGGAWGDFFSVGSSGSDTSFSGSGIATRTASGGGGGSSNYYYPPYVPVPATSGGSGGGATNIAYSESFQPFGFYQGSLQSAGASGNSGAYTPAEGFGGGGSNGTNDAQAGGGGGGAGGAGGDVPGYNPANNITTTAGNYRGGVGGTGVTFLYHSVGGGGGGGNRASAPAPSTTYGGGLGASSTAPHSRDFFSPFAAVAPATGSFATGGRFASGGGGGGGGSPTMNNPNFYGGFEEAGSGGSGLVVIRYAGSYPYIPYFSTDIDSATPLQPNPPRYIL